MNESILIRIRQMIGPSASYDVFDADLIMNINDAFERLCTLGIGPKQPFCITGDTETWQDFMDYGERFDEGRLGQEVPNGIIQYIFLKTKLIFDPPANGNVTKIYQDKIAELESVLRDISRYGY